MMRIRCRNQLVDAIPIECTTVFWLDVVPLDVESNPADAERGDIVEARVQVRAIQSEQSLSTCHTKFIAERAGGGDYWGGDGRWSWSWWRE